MTQFTRAAIQETRESEGIVHLDDTMTRVTFDEFVPFECDFLIRKHGYKISPSSAEEERVTLYEYHI